MTGIRPQPARETRGDAPIEYDNTPVRVCGEALHPVWWRGRQWAVTTYGLERLDGLYACSADSLLDNVQTYGLPRHMSGKGWVDQDDFDTAWLVAIALHSNPAVRESIKRALVRVP